MSTYPSYVNRRKEEILVNVDPSSVKDRATDQLVKFLNEQNEYWGTFKGKLELSATQLSNVTIRGSKIVDSVLCGSVKIPSMGIELSDIGSSFANISNMLSTEIAQRISADSALSSEISSQVMSSAIGISAYIDSQISSAKDELSNVLSNYTNEICISLSNEVSGCIQALDEKISINTDSISSLSTSTDQRLIEVGSKLQNLSGSISSQIWIEDKVSNLISGSSNLSVVKISREEYELSVANECELCSNVIYVVESDYIDAYDQNIKSVADPQDAHDAANKKYVDDVVSSMHTFEDINRWNRSYNALSSFNDLMKHDPVLSNGIDFNAETPAVMSAIVMLISCLTGSLQ